MAETFQIYTKNTSNCEGLPLQTFERLSQEWTGDSLVIPFGPDREEFDLVGWTDLFGGSPCAVHVARVRWLPHKRPDLSGGPTEAQVGFLAWGGNSGVRILDPDAEPTPGVDDHLPPGYGRPIVWLQDEADLPLDVRDVVTRAICEGCGKTLPLSVSPTGWAKAEEPL